MYNDERQRVGTRKTRGIQGGVSCPNSNSGTVLPISNSQLPTIAPNLNLHIPTIEYQSLGGNMNIWVDLQFTTTDDGKMWWVLDDSGVKAISKKESTKISSGANKNIPLG